MGMPGIGLPDAAGRVASGTFTGTGVGAALQPAMNRGFNLSIWGTFVATITLQRSFDGGTTYIPVTYSDGTQINYSVPGSGSWQEAESGVLYALNCTAFTSGTVNWRLSQ